MLLIHSMDISSEEDERTLTMVDPSYGVDNDSSCFHAAAAVHVAPYVVAEALQPSCIDEDTNHICGTAGTSSAIPEALQQDMSMPQQETAKSAERYQDEILKKLEDAFQQLTSKR